MRAQLGKGGVFGAGQVKGGSLPPHKYVLDIYASPPTHKVGLQKSMGHELYSRSLAICGKKVYVLRHKMITVSKYYPGIPGKIF